MARGSNSQPRGSVQTAEPPPPPPPPPLRLIPFSQQRPRNIATSTKCRTAEPSRSIQRRRRKPFASRIRRCRQAETWRRNMQNLVKRSCCDAVVAAAVFHRYEAVALVYRPYMKSEVNVAKISLV
jgi:hypothetical protein